MAARRSSARKKTTARKKKETSRREPSSGSASRLPAWDSDSGMLHVLVDTPKGSRIKYKLDPKKDCYTISHIMAPGAVFPFDFGSIPSTSADDGDPLDVLILLEEP